MAKITKHGGPSYVGTIVAAVVGAAAESAVESAPDESPAEPVEVPESDVPVAPGVPYDTWLLVDLQDELFKRGLPKSGNKPELVQRLIDDDAAGNAEDAED